MHERLSARAPGIIEKSVRTWSLTGFYVKFLLRHFPGIYLCDYLISSLPSSVTVCPSYASAILILFISRFVELKP